MTQTSDRPSGIDPELEPDTLDDQDYEVPWALEDHHRDWQSTLRGFFEREVAPGAAERSIAGVFDADLARAAGQLGVYGLLADERYGGGGADLRTLCLTAEELARVDSSLAVTVHVQAITAALFHHLADGREDLLGEVLPGGLHGGDLLLLRAHRAHRRLRRRQHRHHGAPRRRRLGHQRVQAVHHQLRHPVLPVRDPLRRHGRRRTGANGRSRRRSRPSSCRSTRPASPSAATYPKLGWRSSDTHPLFFDDVRIPGSDLLGEEGRGYREALAFLTWARIPIAAMAAGLAHGCLERHPALRHRPHLVRHAARGATRRWPSRSPTSPR